MEGFNSGFKGLNTAGIIQSRMTEPEGTECLFTTSGDLPPYKSIIIYKDNVIF
jgi:hypothetical protein